MKSGIFTWVSDNYYAPAYKDVGYSYCPNTAYAAWDAYIHLVWVQEHLLAVDFLR